MKEKSELQEYLEKESFIVKSECAISLVNTKLQIINAELSMRHNRNIIHTRSSRIKSYNSIAAKLKRKSLSEIPKSLEAVNDILGIRAITTYLDDLYEVSDMLHAQEDMRVLREKDYISHPKKSGYRSLHLIIEVPVCFQGGTQWIKMEVQLRTTAMDYWAELDYQLQYKKEQKAARQIGEVLQKYSAEMEELDQKVLELRKRIEAL